MRSGEGGFEEGLEVGVGLVVLTTKVECAAWVADVE